MSGKKRFIAILLSFAMIVSLLPSMQSQRINAASGFKITSPTVNQLVAAGYIDIKWTVATGGTVDNYTVYINNQAVGTTKNTSYEYYSTKVVMNQVYVEARYTNGETERTDTVKFGVSKKGLGLATDMGANLDLKGMNLSWYYNWGTYHHAGVFL